MIKIATVAELLVKIGADSQGLRKELAVSQRQIKRAFSPEQMAISETVITGASAFTVALGAVGVASVKMAADMEQNKIAFTTMLGSAQKADTFLRELATFAEKTPFEFPGLVASSKKLLAFGFQAQEIIPMMTGIGDAVSAVGGSAEVLDRVTLAFGQMKTKGMVSAEEMNQLAEAGIPAWEMLSKTIGTDIPTAMDLAEKKSINANAAIAGMISQMGEKYGGMMDKQSNTITGILSNIQDKSGAIMRDMGEDITEALDLKTKLKDSLAFLDEFADKVKASGVRQALLEMIPDTVIIAAIGATSLALTATLLPAIARVTLAAKGMWLAIGGPTGILIAGGSMLIGAMALEARKGGKSIDTMNDSINEGNMYLNSFTGAANKASDSIGRLNSSGIEGGLSKVGEEVPWFDEWQAMAEKAQKEQQKPASSIIMPDKKEAAQVMKANAEYALEVEKQNARNMVDLAQKEAEDLERQRGDGMQAIREYWRTREKEDSAGLASIKKYWDKRTAIETSGIDQEIKALNSEIAILNDQINNTSDASQQIDLKKKLLSVTTDLVLKERERGEVLKKNKDLENKDSITYIEKYAQLLENTKKSMDDLNRTNVTLGLKGSTKAYIDIENERTARLKSVQDVVDAYKRGAADILSENQAAAIADIGIVEWQAAQNEMINKQADDKIVEYHRSAKDIQADVDEAYNAGSLSMLQKALTDENAIIKTNADARLEMMELYEQAKYDSTLTWQEATANLYTETYSSFKENLADILSGTKSIGDAWQAVGVTIRNTIATMVANWIAGRLAMALFNKKNGDDNDKQTSKDVSLASKEAAAWWPAAIARSLATAGANAAPAIAGMSAATIAGKAMSGIAGKATGGPISGPGTGTSDSILTWLSNGEYVVKASAVRALGMDNLNLINRGILPGFATGGLVTGPSLSSVSGRFSSAASLPKAVIEKDTSNNSQDQRPADQFHIEIQAWDGLSVERWLDSGGGAKITKYLKRQVRSFAPVGV